ncbi:MAG: alanine racemase [Rhodothermia bacterium]|nr:MAG: alanine racemase [Rhodothermia bacterium]
MNLSRRSFFELALLSGLSRKLLRSSPAVAKSRVRILSTEKRSVDPWIVVSRDALLHNTQQVSRLAGGRPILAVVKNNAYGLGLGTASGILADFAEIGGFADVKASSCLKLRENGVSKPVLLMGLTPDELGAELIRHDIQLSAYTPGAVERLTPLARKAGKPASVHFYLDTGMGRMGMPFRKALPWMKTVASSPLISVEGTFMAFTEDQEFDLVQLERFKDLVGRANADRVPTGRIHAASSNGVFHLPEAHFDMVRPGIALYGAYPSRPDEERGIATLIPAFSLKTSVVRVARLQKGDGVSYGRYYVAEKPTWIATLSIGHADGYSRRAVDGAEVLIGDQLYPVIGAVSASHTIVELGDEKTVDVGDTASLIGPEHPAIHPNNFADTVGISVYDVLMHMNPDLERVVV